MINVFFVDTLKNEVTVVRYHIDEDGTAKPSLDLADLPTIPLKQTRPQATMR
jgi:hypothetical protein